MSLNLEKHVEEAIVDFVQKNYGFRSPELTWGPAARNGDNFASDVFRVQVVKNVSSIPKYRRFDTRQTSTLLHLIVKISPRSETRRELYHTALQFAREHYTYTSLLPAFELFQQQYLPHNEMFDNYPRMLHCNLLENKEFIILEDLRCQNYHTSYRPRPLSNENAMAVIKSLARFHAISFAYKEQNPQCFDRLTNPLEEISFKDGVNEILDPHLQGLVENSLSTLSESPEDEEIKKRLGCFPNLFDELIRRCLGAKEDAIVLHGDCWTTNFMFRQEKHQIAMKFIDWQGTRYGSPAIDLSYFLFCCTDSKFRNNLQEILAVYHQELTVRIKELGSDAQQVFRFDDLKRHMQKYARFGLGMALLTLHVTTCESDKMPDLSKVFDNVDPAEMENVVNTLYARPEYRERISGVLRDIVRFGYL